MSTALAPDQRYPSSRWLILMPPLMLALFFAGILVLLWLLRSHDASLQRSNLVRDIQWAEASIARQLKQDQELLDRMALVVANTGRVTEAYDTEASDHLQEAPAIEHLAWNRPNGDLQWSLPVTKSVSQILRERAPIEELQRIMRLTAAMNRGTYSIPYRDYDGASYIQYHSPVFRGDEFMGTVSATYALSGIMHYLVPPAFTEKYHLSFVDSEENELYSDVPSHEVESLLTHSVLLSTPWRDLHLKATSYKPESLIAQNLVTAIAVALLAFLAWSIWLMQRHINKRIETDRALTASHERFVTVLDALDAAVYVATLDDGRILFMNETCRQRFPGGKIGGRITELERVFAVAPSIAFQRELLLSPAGEAGAVLKDEFEDVHTERWYIIRGKAIRWVDGRLVRMHMAADVTDRKRAEAKTRQQQEKLMQTARLLTAGEMASTLAHEINQPLAAIANYNNGCVKRLKSGQWREEELISAMEKAGEQAQRAGRVVQRVREFVKNRAPIRGAIDINHVIGDVVRLSELDAEKEGITWDLRLSEELPDVHADRIMIEQVVLNLVKNAMEAMHATPMTRRQLIIETLHNPSSSMAEIRVIDRGKGINSDEEVELFSPFFTTKPHGMGIGLNICRSIIELHEGQLWFTRNIEGGSTFHFSLPLITENA